jgi:hypothetical protein
MIGRKVMRAPNEKVIPLRPFSSPVADHSPRELVAQARIAALQALPFKGLTGLALFLLISTGAFYAVPYQWSLPPRILEILGPSPPVFLTSLALVVYCFSAVLLILPHLAEGTDRYRGWQALGFLSAFYIFYFYARALETNFWAVFAAGCLVLGLEYLSLVLFCRKEIDKERERLQHARRALP